MDKATQRQIALTIINNSLEATAQIGIKKSAVKCFYHETIGRIDMAYFVGLICKSEFNFLLWCAGFAAKRY